MAGKTLKEKLGWKPGVRTLLLNLPTGLTSPFAGDAHSVAANPGETFGLILAFAAEKASLALLAPVILGAAAGDGAKVWLCYPKGSSKMKTDINRDSGWEPMFQAGWIVVSIVSVDATWSAVRFRPKHLVKTACT